jgi:hypothetical protein
VPIVEVKEGENLVVPKADQKEEQISYSNQQGFDEATEASSPSPLAKKSKWITQTFQEEQGQVGAKIFPGKSPS